MGSMEMEDVTEEAVKEEKIYKEKAMDMEQNNLSSQKIMVNKRDGRKIKNKFYFLPKFGCMRVDDDVPMVEMPAADGGFNMEVACNGRGHSPTHLVVMANGIFGSESNHSTLTFDGVDVMGKRLADEVISVVNRHPNLQKISLVGHSFGGLITRYAIAALYQQDLIPKHGEEIGEYVENECNKSSVEEKPRGNIAGLEPMNFITSATPHLGSRGHKQVPVFCGFYTMEKLASHASWLLGRTGKHLFLTDCDDGKPPLLLRMSSDSEDLKFISALQLLKRRVAYANARFDHLVGWSSSSLRRQNELPKRHSLMKNAKYPHIVNGEKSSMTTLHPGANVARGRTREMEETMIRGLTRLNWERIDVNFSGSIQKLIAHSTIQVKNECINADGADVIQHMIDNFQL